MSKRNIIGNKIAASKFPSPIFLGEGESVHRLQQKKSWAGAHDGLLLWAIVARGRATDNVKGYHLSPYSKLTSPSRWLLQDISLFLIEFLPDKMFMKVPGWNEQDSDPRSSDLIAVSLRGRRFLAPKTSRQIKIKQCWRDSLAVYLLTGDD